MVSAQNISSVPLAGGIPATDRGMVMEETVVSYGAAPSMYRQHVYFSQWGGIIAGSILAIALLMLSGAFAYACGVPAFSGGAYGWGAGIWSVISAIIAFGAGGMLAGHLTHGLRPRHGALAGLLTWALGSSLLYLIFAGAFGGFAHGMGTDVAQMTVRGDLANQPTLDTLRGAAWGTFLSLAVGLLAAVWGGYYNSHVDADKLEAKVNAVR